MKERLPETIRVRVSTQDRDRMEGLAKASGVSLSSWARAELRRAMEQATKRRGKGVLSFPRNMACDPIQVGTTITLNRYDGTPIEMKVVAVGPYEEDKAK